MNNAASLFSLAQFAGDSLPASQHAATQQSAELVGEHAEPLTDEAREDAIKRAGDLMLSRYDVWEREGCIAALGDAHRASSLQRALILGRSAAQVARMERERGLA